MCVSHVMVPGPNYALPRRMALWLSLVGRLGKCLTSRSVPNTVLSVPVLSERKLG